ncbi:related to ribosomal protein L5 precursor, mitochondrial [Cephalotrichum gorgonifer]|uniref:Related to ribosomal protein L5, mitochondrial n=1 Tax=Cephalotrichum gorgonifer TaxID=2041049 RepID=A0AAE8STX3_9PEZI|nr:related to ribosomal protein L5 precursor, mitochondrial [Cephalotrichum gorgonifer]
MSALREGPRMARYISGSAYRLPSALTCRRLATAASPPAVETGMADLESSTLGTSKVALDESQLRAFNEKKSAERSQYQYHPPKYDRGPLHPVQSPVRSDPVARNFMPGPFNIPRLKETFDHTISSDLLTLAYLHKPPGTPKTPERERLRKWVGDSPYFENRPLRGPRGAGTLPILEKDITFRNIPQIHAVHMDSFVPEGIKNYDLIYVARSVMQSISGRCPRVTWVKTPVSSWKTQKGDNAGCKVTIFGDQAFEFVDKISNLVFPKIKDWPGLKAGFDGSGNLTFGFTGNEMALFPEIEFNYDSIPGCTFTIETTATSDRQAKLLFRSLGIPFLNSKA